jgi:hypothetical protein
VIADLWRKYVSRNTQYFEVAALVLILSCAFAFRFYQTGRVPPGFNHDEAAGALDALDTLSGRVSVFYPREGGECALWVYWVAVFFGLLGPGIQVIRAASALAGLATVASTWWMVREIFREEGEGRAAWLAGLTALWLSFSLWHVSLSRVAWPAITVPLLETLFFALLWRALRTGKRRLFLLSGLLLGLSFYTLQPARLLPVQLLLFFLLQWGLARRSETAPYPYLPRYFGRLVAMAAIAAFFFIPLLVYAGMNPGEYNRRVNEIAIWNPDVNRGDPWGLLGRSVLDCLTAFALPLLWGGEWFLDSLTAAFFILGLVVALGRVRGSPYLFCLTWWPVMLLPTILAPADAVPSPTRVVGALPVTFVFPAVGLVFLGETLARRGSFLLGNLKPDRRRLAALLGVVAIAVYPAYSTYHNYFALPVSSDLASDLYHVYAVELAHDMERESNSRAVFILPQEADSSNSPDNTIAFLYHGPASYVWLPDEEEKLAERLTAACHGKEVAYLIRWKAGKHLYADSKDLIPFLLEQHGSLLGSEPHTYYDIIAYRLPERPVDFSQAMNLRPSDLTFGNQMALLGYAYGGVGGDVAAPSGGTTWITLRWQAIGPARVDCTISIVLEDRDGHVVSQVDKALLGGGPRRGTSRWKEGETRNDGYRLSVPPGTSPGDYLLKVVVYEERSGRRLTASVAEADQSALLGAVSVLRAASPTSPDALPIQYRKVAEVTSALRLLGFNGPAETEVSPGEHFTLVFYWQALAKPTRDYNVVLKLRGPGNELSIGSPIPLGKADYLASAWEAGDVVQSWYDGLVPADVPEGTYSLLLYVLPTSGEEEVASVELGLLYVRGRPRSFDIPPMQTPLQVTFDYKVALLGYDLSAGRETAPGKYTMKPGERMQLTLYWQAQAQMDTSYTVFVHLLGPDDEIWRQRDSIPDQGTYPTTGWIKGEVVTDLYETRLLDITPPGEYRIEVGMYQARTGERLPMYDLQTGATGDAAWLPVEITVEPP